MNLPHLKNSTCVIAAALFGLASCQSTEHEGQSNGERHGPGDVAPPSDLDLGVFSLSLSVKDLTASRTFYGNLGFEQIGGVPEQNWIILRNGRTVIGLFQGMFEGNMLTFNPGWTASQNHPEEFTDIRELEERILASGIVPTTPMSDEARAGTGPASLVLVDPDGNPVLIDQHR